MKEYKETPKEMAAKIRQSFSEFSKYIYLYWLNENKAFYFFSSKSWTPGINDRYELESCTILGIGIMRMLKNNKDKVYKPIINYLQ